MSWPDRLRTATMDESNDSALNLIYIGTGVSTGNAMAVSTAMSQMSVGHQAIATRETAIIGPSIASGGSGSFPSHRDMITLEFQSDTGAVVSITQAAPKVSTLQPDLETVNPLNADVADAITNILTYATDIAGVALVEYRRGWKWFFSE